MNAVLAARRTAAEAVLAGYTAAVRTADVAGRALWGAQLADVLAALLLALGDGDTAAPLPTPAAQLEEIRLVLEAFDWELSDRQLALEAIERIVSGGES